MKVRYLGKSDPIGLQHNAIYEVLELSDRTGWYRIVTEYDGDEEGYPKGYLYPPEDFEIVED